MINLNGIRLKNRFIVAAGPWSFYWKVWPFLRPEIFGGFTTNTFTIEPREGNLKFLRVFGQKIFPKPWSVVRKIPRGWINSSGWRNPGIEWAVKEFYPDLRKRDTNIIFSIGGFCVEDYLIMIRKLNNLNLAAVELNISCPNVGSEVECIDLLDFFIAAKHASSHPLIVKVGTSRYFQAALIAVETGIDALTAINTIGGFHAGLENGQGGVGGRRIKYISLDVVAVLKNTFDIPVIASGGIYSFKDCQDFFKSGADAVSFGSVFMSYPWLPPLIVRKATKGA
jgi:dihydroorotate dehydrogenase (NAD+) catalytic subunit